MKKDSNAVVSDEQDTDSGSSDEEEDNNAMVVESLIAGRERRSTAGNRLSTLIDREADDELELLFAEDENDVEFEETDVEDQSDVQFDSSDDDEDQGPTGDKGDEDLAGEEELQKEARTERQTRKRKAQEHFFKPPALRKKVKIDPTTATAAPTTPTARPKKKSERLSWIPTVAEGPTRASQRTLSVKNKEVIHERLAQSEKRRLRTLAMMEAAAKRKNKAKKKAMTQEDRLAEAERTEKLNSKSLNRWEETEKKRAEEQKARLAALHDRRLEGPVITWWSGLAEWINGKLSFVGKRKKPDPPADGESVVQGKGRGDVAQQGNYSQTAPPAQDKSDAAAPSRELTLEPVPKPEEPLQQVEALRPEEPAGFLDGIHYYASLPEQAHQPNAPQQPQPQIQPPIETPPSPLKPVIEYSTRNLIILENFDPVAVNDRDVQRRILFKGKRFKAQKPIRELCVITSQPARFRDPVTGLPYLNSYAYKEIQKLATNHCRWSSLLGCYVGPESVVARGVPERFLLRQDGPNLARQNSVPDGGSRQ